MFAAKKASLIRRDQTNLHPEEVEGSDEFSTLEEEEDSTADHDDSAGDDDDAEEVSAGHDSDSSMILLPSSCPVGVGSSHVYQVKPFSGWYDSATGVAETKDAESEKDKTHHSESGNSISAESFTLADCRRMCADGVSATDDENRGNGEQSSTAKQEQRSPCLGIELAFKNKGNHFLESSRLLESAELLIPYLLSSSGKEAFGKEAFENKKQSTTTSKPDLTGAAGGQKEDASEDDRMNLDTKNLDSLLQQRTASSFRNQFRNQVNLDALAARFELSCRMYFQETSQETTVDSMKDTTESQLHEEHLTKENEAHLCLLNASTVGDHNLGGMGSDTTSSSDTTATTKQNEGLPLFKDGLCEQNTDLTVTKKPPSQKMLALIQHLFGFSETESGESESKASESKSVVSDVEIGSAEIRVKSRRNRKATVEISAHDGAVTEAQDSVVAAENENEDSWGISPASCHQACDKVQCVGISFRLDLPSGSSKLSETAISRGKIVLKILLANERGRIEIFLLWKFCDFVSVLIELTQSVVSD